MKNCNIESELLEKKQASESQESLEISSAAVQVGENPESEELSGTLPNQDPILNTSDTAEVDGSDTGAISEFPNLLDQYFDSYSLGDGGPPIFLEKDLKLSDLGISEDDGWQKIPPQEMGVHCGDCVEFMKNSMEDEIVDATITSPPYDSLRTYNGYEFDFEATARELFRVTKSGGLVIWVVGDTVVNGSETGTSFRQALFFQEIGFKIHDTMIYEKTGVSYPSIGRYTPIFDYMFVFSKGKPKTFNPICDLPKLWEGSWGKLSTRNKDGSLKCRDLPNEGKGSSGRAEDGRYGYKQRTNIWVIKNGHGFGSRDKIAYEHPAIFPEQLANDHIITWSNPGDLIFDPMCGSGTTLKMALLNARKLIGVDISQKYCEIAVKRLVGVFTKLPVFSVGQGPDRADQYRGDRAQRMIFCE